MRVLVTGATAGIGLSTARILAGMGHTVLVHGRSEAKAARAVATITAAHPGAVCLPQACDLSSLPAVAAWARQLRQQQPAIDVLVNNAGVFVDRSALTADGFERTWAVNHLAPFLLTSLLLEALLARPESRVINVSSVGHRSGQIHFADPNLTGRFSGLRAYCQSKLANVLFTQELARRTEGTALRTYALHPGVIATKLLAQTGFGDQPAEPADSGAETSVFLATSPDIDAPSGSYFVRRRPARPSTTDPALGERLWALSAAQVGISPPQRQ